MRKEIGVMPREYFFISDMHIGGDGELQHCDFEVELFKRTGSKIPITIMPGNHDYELACYPEFVDRLKDYNLNLVPEISITREVAGKRIWIEHGQQHDERNHMPDFGNPHAQPVGYFITTGIVGTAGRYSEFGRGNWLKDVQAVMPITEIPTWTISNYFYREMGPLLRLVLLPFLLLLVLGAVVVLSWFLEAFELLSFNPVLDNPLTDSLGLPGQVVRTVLVFEGVLALLLLLALIPAMIPLGILYRDVRRTLGRYKILMPKTPAQIGDGPYLEAARQVFEQDPSVAVFVYGHTHLASLKEVDGRVVINTGTWLKTPKKVPVLFGQQPPVYIPAFRLNYFRMVEEDGRLAIYYEQIEKKPPSELTWVQRLLTLTKRPPAGVTIPKRTIVGS